jgi:hypothetical protein
MALDEFNEEYFKTRNYVDYLQREDRYVRSAKEITDHLYALSLIEKDSLILDFGSALGFFLHGLKEAGYINCVGYDKSIWATEQALRHGHNMLSHYNESVDVLFALDTFEHMENKEIEDVFIKTKPNTAIVRMPSSSDGGKTFHLDISRRDPTHINCKSKEQWMGFFKSLGYYSIKLRLASIYDTIGVTSLLLIKL